MYTHYWQGHAPKDELGYQALMLLPGWNRRHVESPDLNELEEYLDRYWGHHRKHRCIMPRMGDWMEIQSRHILSDIKTGLVSIKSIADHILGGMSGWLRLQNWWAAICTEIKNLGYSVDVIALDIEHPKCSTRMKFVQSEAVKDKETGEEKAPAVHIKMQDVIGYIYSERPDEAKAIGCPDIDPDYITIGDGNHYQNQQTYQAMRMWDEWTWRRNAQALDVAFGLPARKVFGNDTICSNYDMSAYEGGAPIIVNRTAKPSCPVGKYSAPVLYEKDTRYPDVKAAMAALGAVTGDRTKITPWTLSPRHEGREGYYVTQKSHQESKEAIRARGIKHLLVW